MLDNNQICMIILLLFLIFYLNYIKKKNRIEIFMNDIKLVNYLSDSAGTLHGLPAIFKTMEMYNMSKLKKI